VISFIYYSMTGDTNREPTPATTVERVTPEFLRGTNISRESTEHYHGVQIGNTHGGVVVPETHVNIHT